MFTTLYMFNIQEDIFFRTRSLAAHEAFSWLPVSHRLCFHLETVTQTALGPSARAILGAPPPPLRSVCVCHAALMEQLIAELADPDRPQRPCSSRPATLRHVMLSSFGLSSSLLR